MTQNFQAKLYETKSRGLINLIREEMKKAGSEDKNDVNVEYERRSKVLTWKVIGKKSQINCVCKNIEEPVAEKIKRAFR